MFDDGDMCKTNHILLATKNFLKIFFLATNLMFSILFLEIRQS